MQPASKPVMSMPSGASRVGENIEGSPTRPTILVINDDPVQLRLTTAVLTTDDLHPVPCRSVEEALRALNQLDWVAAIVTDLHMPGIDGWRFCRLLRSPAYPAFNKTPILVVSATFSGADAEQVTTDLGANAFLPAPYEPAVLRSCVRDLIAGSTPQAAMHVLIVDDNVTRAGSIRQAFEAHGYIATLATTVAESLLAYHRRAPEVAVISHQLPHMEDGDPLRHFKQPGASTVAIVITNDPRPEVALNLVRGGADGCVREPFAPDYLVDLGEKARRERALIRIEELLEERTRQLRESEAQVRALFEAIPEAVVIHDAHGTVRYVNASGTHTLEASAEALIGTNMRDYLVPEDTAGVERLMQRVLANDVVTFEAMVVTRSGRRVQAAVSSKRIEFEGQPAILSVARDVTAQKELERQRADFVAMLAHDIRNPLAVVAGYAEMLLSMGGLDPDREDIVHRIEANSHCVVALANNYLDLSKIEAGCLSVGTRSTDLGDILHRVCERYECEARKRDLTFERHLEEAVLNGDALALERVFSNLIHNAIKFTPPHGRIIIRSGRQDGMAVGIVTDTGPGIAPDDLPVLFERYRSSSSSEHSMGTGLGLFIAKALVEAHGGTIAVETAPGRGTSFIVRVPTRAAEANAA